MKRITLLVASVLALVGMSSLAHAKPSVAVLGLEVIDNGSVDKRATQAAQDLADELRSQVGRSGGQYSLAPNSAKDLLELKLLSDCGDENKSCMADIGKELGADRLLYGKLERRKNSYQVSLKLLNTNTKEMERTTSEVIPEADLHGSKITRWSRSLYSRLIGVPESGTLRLDANVDKATIYIDGKVATTLRDGSAKVVGLDEGVHKVAIEADGYKRYEADVAITAGDTESLAVSLSKIGSTGGGDDEAGSGNTWKYSFYAGVLLTAGSAGGWAYYGQQIGRFVGEGSLVQDKDKAWLALQGTDSTVAGEPQMRPTLAEIISDGTTSGPVRNACGKKKTDLVMGADRDNPNFEKFVSACDAGKSAATRSTILAYSTGVLAVVTGYLGYRAFAGDNKEKRMSKGKDNTSSRIVLTPRLGLDSVGADLSLEF